MALTKPKQSDVNINIRPVSLNDENIWWDLFSAYLSTDGSTLPDEVYRSTFNRFCQSHEGVFGCLLAQADGAAVGFIHFLSHRSTWSLNNVVYIQDLFVHPTARNKGIAKHLINAVYEIADEAGTPHVYWITQKDNATARKLYDGMAVDAGYVKYQRA